MPPEAKPPLVTRAFVLAWVSHFFHSIATAAFVHLPGFLAELGATKFAIGTLFGVTAAIAVGARPALGRSMDRHGARGFILGAGALHVVLCAGYLAIDRLTPAVYLLRAAHGVVEAVIFSILFAYAAEIVPKERRTEGIAWFGVSAQIPIALGTLGGDLVLARTTYHGLFALTVAASALGLLFSLSLRLAPRAADPVPARGLVATATQPDLLPLWFIGVVFTTSIAPMFIFLKTYVMHRGVGSVGLFFALYSLSATLLRVFFGWVPDRVGPRRTLAPAILGVAVGVSLIAHAESAVELAVAGVLAGAGHGLAFPIIVGLVVERSRPSERAVSMSLVTSIFDMGQLVGGPLFGAIIDTRGYATAYDSAAALAATGVIVFALWDRAPRAPPVISY